MATRTKAAGNGAPTQTADAAAAVVVKKQLEIVQHIHDTAIAGDWEAAT
jgi:hypothetical protein